MPIPKPRKGEDKDKFIERCMANTNMQEYDQNQRAAICFAQWKKKPKAKKGK